MKKPRSHLVTAVLAGCTLYFAQSLSRSGRSWIDWVVITLVGLGVLWNLYRLGQRLHRTGGGRDLWHLLRTVVFWVVGLFNTLVIRPADHGSWKHVLGWVLLGVAALDTIALYRKERASMRDVATGDAGGG